MTKASQEGQLLDFVAAALLSHGYNSVLNMPDQLDKALRKAMNENGIAAKFPDLDFSFRGMHLVHLIRRAPNKRRQYFTNWTTNSDEELPRCEYHSNTTSKDLFNALAVEHGITSKGWEAAAGHFVAILRREDYKVLVKADETHEQVRARFPSRG